MDQGAARNALGAMINRASKSGEDLGRHVSRRIYQPTIEANQQARLDRILASPAYADLTGWAQRRAAGQEDDPVQGATHFLAPESTMLALERRNPSKYKNWGPRGANWTGYNPETGQYNGVVMRDASHAFLAPDGAYSLPVKNPNVAMNAGATGMSPTGTAGISGSIHSATPSPPSPLFKDTAPAPAPAPTMVAGAPAGAQSGAFAMPGTSTMGNIGQAAGGFASAMGQQQNAAAQASQQAAADADQAYQARLAQWLQQIRSRRA